MFGLGEAGRGESEMGHSFTLGTMRYIRRSRLGGRAALAPILRLSLALPPSPIPSPSLGLPYPLAWTVLYTALYRVVPKVKECTCGYTSYL